MCWRILIGVTDVSRLCSSWVRLDRAPLAATPALHLQPLPWLTERAGICHCKRLQAHHALCCSHGTTPLKVASQLMTDLVTRRLDWVSKTISIPTYLWWGSVVELSAVHQQNLYPQVLRV